MKAMSVTLQTPLAEVLGDRSARAIQRAFGYSTVGQLLEHYPRRYASRGELTSLSGVPVGEAVSIVAEVVSVVDRPMQKRRGSLLEVTITDGTGLITLTFFNQAWRAKDLRPGVRGLFAGKIGVYRGGKQLAHPDYELFDHDLDETSGKKWADTPIPLYPATGTLASWQIARAIGVILDQLAGVPDPLPDTIRVEQGLLSYDEALRRIHRPATAQEWMSARDTLRFHEAFLMQVALLQQRSAALAAGARVRTAGQLRERFDRSLPFALTGDQRSVGNEIAADLASGHPMHRLVHGEVGSGKTVVAVRAMLQVAEDGGQTALLAPTEVLATQHLRSIVHTLGPELAAEIHPVVLTGSLPSAERRKVLLQIAAGQARLVVGTHALLGEGVQFHDLGLVIVDEQHRFGVEQRDTLRHKGDNPHLLVLTATPIPRTVAMTVFGDLDVSTIRELPAGRAPISTHVVAIDDHPEWYQRVWSRVREEVDASRRVFVVCPAIDPKDRNAEENADEAFDDDGAERPPVTGVLEMVQILRQMPVLAGLTIEPLHGRMDTAQKDQVMSGFQRGDVHIVVATTVIEVGVDVPDATVMVVMDADRFGISQLHQLRGRVGRGGLPGLCLLLTHAPADSPARERLDAVASTLDGFALSLVDLEMRREGDVLGARQSGGKSSLRLLRVASDQVLIERARSLAESLLARDPQLENAPALGDALSRRLTEQSREFLEKG